MANPVRSHTGLKVYRMAFEAAMSLYELSKEFPKAETYSLTDQIRRSSRSVASNLAEARRRRRYRAAFINKLNECESEAAETQVWIEFCVRSGYLTREQAAPLYQQYDEVIGILVRMINNPDRWLLDKS